MADQATKSRSRAKSNGDEGAAAVGAEDVAAEPAPSPAPERGPSTYRIFEVPGATLEPGVQVTYLGDFTADSKTAARWAAIDADPARQERAQVEEGQEGGGVFLVAMAERMAQPERTVETIVRVAKRS